MLLFAQQTAENVTDAGEREMGFAPLWMDQGIPLALMGITVVFVALFLVTLFIALLPRVNSALSWLLPEEEERHPVAAPVAGAVPGEPDERPIVAALAVLMHRRRTTKKAD